jgi:hypothetical protein
MGGLCCRNSVKLQPMPDQPKTQPLGNLLLEPLDLGAPELNHSSSGRIDQVVVVRLGCFLIVSTAVRELVPFNNVDLLEPLTPVPLGHTAMQLGEPGAKQEPARRLKSVCPRQAGAVQKVLARRQSVTAEAVVQRGCAADPARRGVTFATAPR